MSGKERGLNEFILDVSLDKQIENVAFFVALFVFDVVFFRDRLASSKVSILSKSTPAYFLTASTIEILSKGLSRSKSTPSKVILPVPHTLFATYLNIPSVMSIMP